MMSHYLGWQCNLGCRYQVFTNSTDANQHLADVHGRQPTVKPGRRPLRPATWIGLATITAGLLVVIGAAFYLSMAR